MFLIIRVTAEIWYTFAILKIRLYIKRDYILRNEIIRLKPVKLPFQSHTSVSNTFILLECFIGFSTEKAMAQNMK
jgi:hypothetical protein